MGRRKVELKLIGDKSSRQVTFSKRRKGLFKKAADISVLCDVQLALVIFSPAGRLYEFSSGDSFSNILNRHRTLTQAAVPESANDEDNTSNEFSRISPSGLLELIQRYVVDDSAEEQLTVNNLVQLEKQLELTLTLLRDKKIQLMLEPLKTLQEMEGKLKQENELLKEQIAAAAFTDHNLLQPVTLQLLELV